MKTYHLLIIVGNNLRDAYVQADYFDSTTSGCYGFCDDKGRVVACYPINRTIISKIEQESK
jgi:hypothetical protein